jgi:hypothetical protein
MDKLTLVFLGLVCKYSGDPDIELPNIGNIWIPDISMSSCQIVMWLGRSFKIPTFKLSFSHSLDHLFKQFNTV